MSAAVPRIGVFLPGPEATDPVSLAAAAAHAEDRGLESVWISDQVNVNGTPALDPLVVLAAAAGATTRIGLGTGVLAPGPRPVALLAAQVAAVHAISGERLLLGLGLGGPPTDSLRSATTRTPAPRGRAFDTAVDELTRLLDGDAVPLAGTDLAAPARIRPAGRPPLLVGGQGRRSMRRAVALGAEWMPSMFDADGLARAVEDLRAEAERQGLPVPAVTVAVRLADTDDTTAVDAFRRQVVDVYGYPADEVDRLLITDDVGDALAEYGAAGAGRVVVAPIGGTWNAAVDRLASVTSVP